LTNVRRECYSAGTMATERLQKILAAAGVASRRAAERYIRDGRVKVNGETVDTLGSKADPKQDRIEVQGWGVIEAEPLVYIAMHKPAGVVTTVDDPEGRPTVMTVLGRSRALGSKQHEGNMPRVYPVGRLDYDAEGILLLTNDGELANALLHPKHHVPKTYVVKVKGRPEPAAIHRLEKGVRLKLEEGGLSRPTAPADVRVIRESPSNTWLELVITEGRTHQVKRMCEAVGHFAIRLIRIDFGGIGLDPLPAGGWRFLTNVEIKHLKNWITAAPRAPTRQSSRRATRG
jgi:23S rRNA pseudouridine2605 synthase